MAKITDPDNLFYAEYTFNNSIDPEIANNGLSANMLIDYENKRFALTAPRYGIIASGLSSEMVGYGATGGVSGQALYSKFKNIWKDDPVAIRFPFPMEAITPESFEFINGWLPDDNTVSLQTGVNTSFITRKLIKDAGWAERTPTGDIARRYFGTITLGAISLANAGFTTVYYNAVNPGLQTSFVIDTDGGVNTVDNLLEFDGVVGNGNTYSSAPYFYTGDAVVYQTDGTETVSGLTTNSVYYIRYGADGGLPTTVGHSLSLHTTREDSLNGSNPVALTGGVTGKIVTLTSAGKPEDLFFGITEERSFANEPVQFFATANDDGTTVIYNRDNYFELFVREEGRTYSKQSIGDIGVNQLNFQTYRFPLTSSTDINITVPDGDGTTTGIGTGEYAGIGISFYQTPITKTVQGVPAQFNIIINADQQPLRVVYSKVQYLLRQSIRVNSGINGDDINSLSGIGYIHGDGAQDEFANSFRFGAIVQPLLEFVGDRLDARPVLDIFNESEDSAATTNSLSNLGVYIDNVAAGDVNNVRYISNAGQILEEAFTATVDLTFNNNLFGDGEAKFWTFYDIPTAPGDIIPGLSTSLSLEDVGVFGATDGIISAENEFTVGSGPNHPFVTGQKVVAIGQEEDPGVGFAMTTSFNPNSLGADGQAISSYTYYLNIQKATGVAQTYFDVTETGISPSVAGIGLTDKFRLHSTYADAIANNFAGINTISIAAQALAGIVTFRQIDVNFSENNATIVRTGNVIGNGVGADEYLDGINIPENGEVTFSYDYDSNTQRNRTPFTNANIRVVAVGLQTGQYASATASITRAKGQAVSVTGALERVYSNPS